LAAGGIALTALQVSADPPVAPVVPLQPGYGQDANAIPPAKDRVAPSDRAMEAPADFKASSIIGLPVRDQSGEPLGRVQDLILSMTSHSVPYAIVETSSTADALQTRVAVPWRNFRWAGDSKTLTLATTKAHFEAASTAPKGGWVAISQQDWAKGVDRYYGQPVPIAASRYERQEATYPGENAQTVRAPSEMKGATGLQNPGSTSNPPVGTTTSVPLDDYILQKVNDVISRNAGVAGLNRVQATVRNGVVRLQGSVASEAQKQAVDNQIRAIAGVDRVEDHLRTPSE
jgi:osmotically-inducible protein OsmY/sporulation protein YlmC with PRC-barrel domain